MKRQPLYRLEVNYFSFNTYLLVLTPQKLLLLFLALIINTSLWGQSGLSHSKAIPTSNPVIEAHSFQPSPAYAVIDRTQQTPTIVIGRLPTRDYTFEVQQTCTDGSGIPNNHTS